MVACFDDKADSAAVIQLAETSAVARTARCLAPTCRWPYWGTLDDSRCGRRRCHSPRRARWLA